MDSLNSFNDYFKSRMPKVLPEYKEQATKRILHAAQQVFAEKGYYEARMEDIAAKVGVSKMTLYLYFKNKEDLFAAIAAEQPQSMQRMLDSTLSNAGFAQVCEAFFDHVLKEPASGLNYEIIAAASRNPALKKTVRELYEKETSILAEFLQNQKRKGLLDRRLDPMVLARSIIALFDGLMADLVIGVDKSEVRRAWLESTRALVSGASTPIQLERP